ncbi:hypothetical protein TCAL_06834 [Tigriopus californicus]|uniref:BTB domain-containing protein n=1 Tax=Tigriopus californicus TaxID=6832 RepID=A0A553NTZ9_TIGCA|nr:zinc finger protein 43-like [Tigriopus californicus]TRY68901.1 hypothetical protein TCAL_06834 [Tigriopus californicus]|eukprot:TCALIF_06834-PA protein Name:"Similar to ZBTB47 Zinc finger and BTB domain-containing protein 47 (Homo sapiens)" AED:0.02 eAED:0.02 QI:659/1/1/1/1/1/2/136/632
MGSDSPCAKALAASNLCRLLDEQRLLKSSFCDVILKCGPETSYAHSAVLGAASGFFDKILLHMIDRNEIKPGIHGIKLIQLEVDDLFVGTEHLFQDIISFLYTGVKGDRLNDEIISALHHKLELHPQKMAPNSQSTQGRTHPPPGLSPSSGSFSQPSELTSQPPGPSKEVTTMADTSATFFTSASTPTSHLGLLDWKDLCGEVITAVPSISLNSGHTNVECEKALETGEMDLAAAAVSSLDEAKFSKVNDVKMDVSFCHKCDLLFISKEEFLIHRQMNCTRKFSCKSCGLLFTRVQSLLEHLVEVRHGESICSICHYAATTSAAMDSHLQNHMKVTKKPYFCLQCESRFPTRSALIQHLPKHSNETPFICNVCTKGFKWKQALSAHMVTHSTAKRHSCSICDFSTSHTSIFKSHQRLHNGMTLKCDLDGCTFETTRKYNFDQHKLTHSKEKLHQCEVCGKSFSLVKNMRRHARQHDEQAKKQRCPAPDCRFETLRTDKYVLHKKKCPFLNPGLGDDQQTHTAHLEPSSLGKTNSRISHPPQKAVVLNNLFNTVNPPNKTVIQTLPLIINDDSNPLDTASLDVTIQDMLKLSENLVLELDSTITVKQETALSSYVEAKMDQALSSTTDLIKHE